MQITNSNNVRISFTKEELTRMAASLQDDETLILRIDLEDAGPLWEKADGHISRYPTVDNQESRRDIGTVIVLERI